MQEATAAVSAAVASVLERVEPLEAAWRAELARLQDREARRMAMSEDLTQMERRTANL
jgi:hypothetical protein